MQHAQGQRRWKPQGGRAEAALAAEFLSVVNAERRLPHTTVLRQLFADQPDPTGRARVLCSTPTGAVLRCTLIHGLELSTVLAADEGGWNLTRDDITRVELLVARPGSRAPIPAGGDGPLPHTQRITSEEFELVAAFYRELLDGARYEGVTLSHDPAWPHWAFLEIPYPGRPDRHIVTALPLQDGPWGEARESGFLFVVSANGTSRRTRLRLEGRVRLCDPVRRHTVVNRAQ